MELRRRSYGGPSVAKDVYAHLDVGHRRGCRRVVRRSPGERDSYPDRGPSLGLCRRAEPCRGCGRASDACYNRGPCCDACALRLRGIACRY